MSNVVDILTGSAPPRRLRLIRDCLDGLRAFALEYLRPGENTCEAHMAIGVLDDPRFAPVWRWVNGDLRTCPTRPAPGEAAESVAFLWDVLARFPVIGGFASVERYDDGSAYVDFPDPLLPSIPLALARVAMQPEPGMVYLIEAGTTGRFKIGLTQNLASRLAALQTGNPERLRVVATLQGGPKLEAELHGHFGHARLSGEWFQGEMTDSDRPEFDVVAMFKSLARLPGCGIVVLP